MENKPKFMPNVPPFVRFVASAVPMVFDNSMSYYEALCALWKYVQGMTDVINSNAALEQEYITKFNELKEFVDHYFDNLDVQEEINNKLDAMVEAGTLQEIITTYIQSNVAWTFDTVADMKSATNLVAGSYAQTLGFYSIGDGGGALYKITDTGTANEMDVIAIDSLYANLVSQGEITPIMLGAYGDGVADDSIAIRQAFTYLDTIGGGVLNLLDNKVYLLDSTVSAPVGTTFLLLKNNTHVIGTSTLKVADSFGEYNSVFSYDEDLDNCSVEDFTIDANTTGNGTTASTGSTDNFRTEFYFANNPNSIGKFILRNVTINDTIGKWQLTCNTNKNKIIIDGAIVNYNGTANINYDRTSFFLGADNAIIENCILDGNGKAITAIELHGNNNIASNNIIKNYQAGVLCAIDNTAKTFYTNNDCQQVCGNQIRVTKQGVLFFLIDDTTDPLVINDVKIVNNYIHLLSNTALSVALGFSDAFGQNCTVKNIEYSGNTVFSENTKASLFRINCPSSSSGSSNVVETLNVINNTFSGKSDTNAIQLLSADEDKLNIKTINFNYNNVEVDSVTQVFQMQVNEGLEYMNFIGNDIKVKTSFTNYCTIIGTASNTADIRFIDNKIHNEVALSHFIRISGTAYPIIKQNFSKLGLTTSDNKNELTFAYVKMANGSELTDPNITVKKFDDRFGLNYVGDKLAKHIPVYVGSQLQMYNDTNAFEIVTHAGYLPDHDIGTNLTGEWVKYNNQVFQSLTDNNLSTASDDNVNFKLIGTYPTLAVIA